MPVEEKADVTSPDKHIGTVHYKSSIETENS